VLTIKADIVFAMFGPAVVRVSTIKTLYSLQSN
jgi:hypothetical protein